MIIDLSATLESPLPVFEGDPAFSLNAALTVGREGYAVSELRMGTHSGTHIDVPAHVFFGAPDTQAVPLGAFVGEALVLTASVENGFAVLPKSAYDTLRRGDIALIHTGWDEHLRKPDYLIGYPAFREDDMKCLVELGVKAIGTDLPSFETDLSCRIHRILLGAGVMLIESLANLGAIATKRCFFSAAPLKLKGGDGSPVRAYAIV